MVYQVGKFQNMLQHEAKTMAKTGYAEPTVKVASKILRKKKKGYNTPIPKSLALAVRNKDKGRLLG